jgi:hypothetical protein
MTPSETAELIKKIELTEQEKEEAIYQGQLKKYFHEKHKEYWEEKEKEKVK